MTVFLSFFVAAALLSGITVSQIIDPAMGTKERSFWIAVSLILVAAGAGVCVLACYRG
ncbi:MAG: hypothetical protein KGJ09_09270 [Candidatus Omnitrophica bacterium]|nr:hypothetical protein [Candidatus Omnitrophota bacterium]